MPIRHLPLFSLLALSACVPPPPPAPAPRPTPAPVAPAPAQPAPQRPAGEWTDWPIAPGDWSYRAEASGSVALFGIAGREPTVMLRCDLSKAQVLLGREGNSATRMVVRTSSAVKELTTGIATGNPTYSTAVLAPTDPILDAIALSRGRFAIESGSQVPLSIPSWPEIARVLEDCRG
jgi:hypothetical protein